MVGLFSSAQLYDATYLQSLINAVSPKSTVVESRSEEYSVDKRSPSGCLTRSGFTCSCFMNRVDPPRPRRGANPPLRDGYDAWKVIAT